MFSSQLLIQRFCESIWNNFSLGRQPSLSRQKPKAGLQTARKRRAASKYICLLSFRHSKFFLQRMIKSFLGFSAINPYKVYSCWPTKRDKCQVSVAKANALHTNFKQVIPRGGGEAGWGQKQILRKAKHKSDKKRDVYGEKWDDSMCFCLFTHDCITCALTTWSLIHIWTFQILFNNTF